MQLRRMVGMGCSFMVTTAGCLEGGGEQGSPSRTKFTEYWTDGSEWCARQAECGVTSEQECLEYWNSADEVNAALKRADLDDAALERCEQSTRAVDDCQFALSCEMWIEGTSCQKEFERLELDCATLIKALELEVDVPVDATDLAALSDVAATLCEKSEECDGMPLPSDQRAECVELLTQFLGLLIPDPAATASCISATSCAALETDFDARLRDCIDIDPTATRCRGDVLHLCDSVGACTNVPCFEACDFVNLVSVGCGFNADDGYDQCQCSF